MNRSTSVYSDFLQERNRKITRLRKQGKLLKELAGMFNLNIRQINRIINKMSKRNLEKKEKRVKG